MFGRPFIVTVEWDRIPDWRLKVPCPECGEQVKRDSPAILTFVDGGFMLVHDRPDDSCWTKVWYKQIGKGPGEVSYS